MPVRLLTLDCAGTLLRGPWDPVGFALKSAQAAGLSLPTNAAEFYGNLLQQHYPAILAANRTGDPAAVRAAYVPLGEAWLSQLGFDPDLAPTIVDASERLLVSPDLFQPFQDTVPFLKEARHRGLRLAVVSNWDVSLPRVLEAHGLLHLVDDVYASLVVGAEKPDPKMLHLAMASAGVSPRETLHIGDDPTDDLGAATNAGVRGLLLERNGVSTGSNHKPQTTIHTLPEVFPWID